MIKALQSYLKFFSGLIFATIGAAFFVFEKIDDSLIKSLGFVIGGFFVIGISFLGYNAARSNYRRQLESIVKRFKIECHLGLDDIKKYCDDIFMTKEPLLLDRYTQSFSEFGKESSSDFVEKMLKLGFMRVITYFYLLTAIVGLFLIVTGVFL